MADSRPYTADVGDQVLVRWEGRDVWVRIDAISNVPPGWRPGDPTYPVNWYRVTPALPMDAPVIGGCHSGAVRGVRRKEDAATA